jgi:hypothetical protein
MARTVLAVQQSLVGGLATAFTAATADGHGFSNPDGKTALVVKNASGVSTTVTIPTPATVNGLTISDLSVTVAAGVEKIIGGFPKGLFNNDDTEGDTGLSEAVFVNATPTTSVTYAAIRITPAA